MRSFGRFDFGLGDGVDITISNQMIVSRLYDSFKVYNLFRAI